MERLPLSEAGLSYSIYTARRVMVAGLPAGRQPLPNRTDAIAQSQRWYGTALYPLPDFTLHPSPYRNQNGIALPVAGSVRRVWPLPSAFIT